MTKPVYLHTDNDVEILKTFDMVLSHMQAIADHLSVEVGDYRLAQHPAERDGVGVVSGR